MGDARSVIERLRLMPDGADLKKTRREWVYFVQAELDEGLIKIGRTYRLKKRLLALQSQSPVPLKIIGVIDAPRGAEAVFHLAWSAHRLHGEWFVPHVDIVGFVSKLDRPAYFDLKNVIQDFSPLGVSNQVLKQCLLQGIRRKMVRKCRAA